MNPLFYRTCRIGIVVGFTAIVACVFVNTNGCVFALLHGDCGARLDISGRMIDSVTLSGATDVIFGLRVLREGEEISFRPPMRSSGEANFPSPDENGAFTVPGGNMIVACPPIVGFEIPDTIIFTVVRGTCTIERTVHINESSATHEVTVEPGGRTQTVTLKDPILVPPCEQ